MPASNSGGFSAGGTHCPPRGIHPPTEAAAAAAPMCFKSSRRESSGVFPFPPRLCIKQNSHCFGEQWVVQPENCASACFGETRKYVAAAQGLRLRVRACPSTV